MDETSFGTYYDVKEVRISQKKSLIGFLFELPAKQCQLSGPSGQIGRHWLAGISKGNTLTDVFLD